MKKIIVVTGTRADYGLLRKLIQLLQADDSMETHVAVTGSHLSEAHGKTVNQIKADGIKNIIEVNLDLKGDRPKDISCSIGKGTEGFADVYKKIEPDLVVVLGDRYELWGACMPAIIFNIPIAHIHGGESTQGAVDEVIRHTITKMARLHFCAHPDYAKRIKQMGESPSNIHTVGALGIDRIKEMNFYNQAEIEKHTEVTFGKKNILCTFHPVTISESQSSQEIEALVLALERALINPSLKVFITFPNADSFSIYIRKQWDEFINKHSDRVHGFTNLGDQLYLSMMKYVDVIVGNSSSGILEAPFLKKAVLDIGLRQKGRLASKHILHAEGTSDAISAQLEKALSEEFQTSLESAPSIYGNGESSEKIFRIIKEMDLKKLGIKEFFDFKNDEK